MTGVIDSPSMHRPPKLCLTATSLAMFYNMMMMMFLEVDYEYDGNSGTRMTKAYVVVVCVVLRSRALSSCFVLKVRYHRGSEA